MASNITSGKGYSKEEVRKFHSIPPNELTVKQKSAWAETQHLNEKTAQMRPQISGGSSPTSPSTFVVEDDKDLFLGSSVTVASSDNENDGLSVALPQDEDYNHDGNSPLDLAGKGGEGHSSRGPARGEPEKRTRQGEESLDRKEGLQQPQGRDKEQTR